MINQRLPLEVTRTERPTPDLSGIHFRSSGISFWRKTLLECGQTKILVSTTGGYGRYKTEAFHADPDSVDSDSFKGPYYLDYLTPEPYNAFADNVHEIVVAQITKNLESGTVPDQCISHILFGDE